MTDPNEVKRNLVYAGIQVINDCVEKLPTWELRSEALQQLREHLEARAEQCHPDPVAVTLGHIELRQSVVDALTAESAGYDPRAPWPTTDELNPANWPEQAPADNSDLV